jgi:hypothetical protein
MATIVKSYTFLPKITIDASEVNRNFDDLFATINTLNSENIISTATFPASQITIIDSASNYTSAEVEGVFEEANTNIEAIDYRQRGTHTIHIMPQGTGPLAVFPGALEINGKMGFISTRLNISGLLYLDGGDPSGSKFLVCGQPATGEEITASDISLIDFSSAEPSEAYSVSRAGYYYQDKRVFGAVFNTLNNVDAQAFVDAFNPDPPQNVFSLELEQTEAEGVGFDYVDLTAAETEGTWIRGLTRFSNNFGLYSYHIRTNLGDPSCASWPGDNIIIGNWDYARRNLTPIPFRVIVTHYNTTWDYACEALPGRVYVIGTNSGTGLSNRIYCFSTGNCNSVGHYVHATIELLPVEKANR